MAISSAFKLPFHSLVISLALAFVACGSDGTSDTLGGGGGRIDDPEPSDGGAGSRGPGPSEPGAAGGEPDGEGGGGTAGASGEPGPAPEPSGGATSEPEPEPVAGAGGGPSEEPEPEPTEAELRGEVLVEKNGCVTCHQANFAGFSVFPNITPDRTTGIGAWTDEQIKKAIRDGVDADGATMCPTMARYPFTDEELADVVAFLRGLPPVASKVASACPGHG